MNFFPDVLIRRGRRKDVGSTSRRTSDGTNYVLRTPGRNMTSGKISYKPKVGRPLNVTSECDVLGTPLVDWVVSENQEHHIVWMLKIKLNLFSDRVIILNITVIFDVLYIY